MVGWAQRFRGRGGWVTFATVLGLLVALGATLFGLGAARPRAGHVQRQPLDVVTSQGARSPGSTARPAGSTRGTRWSTRRGTSCRSASPTGTWCCATRPPARSPRSTWRPCRWPRPARPRPGWVSPSGVRRQRVHHRLGAGRGAPDRPVEPRADRRSVALPARPGRRRLRRQRACCGCWYRRRAPRSRSGRAARRRPSAGKAGERQGPATRRSRRPSRSATPATISQCPHWTTGSRCWTAPPVR